MRCISIVLAGMVVLVGCASKEGDRAGAGRGGSGVSVRGGEGPSESVADPGFLDQFASTFRFRLGAPASVKPLAGGEAVLFLRGGARSFVQDLYEFDTRTGRERVLLTAQQVLAGQEEVLTAEERARRERMRLASRGIATFEVTKDGRRILVPLSGRLFIIEREGGAVRELRSSGGFPIDPRFCPQGRMVACVRDGELFVTDIDSGQERRVTSGAGGTVTHALAEFVAQEEMDRREGYWWSPDASMIAFQRTDTAGLEVFHIADPMFPEREPQAWPYPRAGKANARVTLGIVRLDGAPEGVVWALWDAERYPYLASVKWQKGAPLTILVQNRTQTEQTLLEVDTVSGSTRPIMVERDSAWLNLRQSVPSWDESGERFLWISESGGEPMLELRGRDGAVIETLTPPGFGLEDLIAADHSAGEYFVAASANPTERHVWKVSGGRRAGPRRLTEGQAVHGAAFAPDFSSWVQWSSPLRGERSWTVHRADGSEAGRLTSVAERPSFAVSPELTVARSSRTGRQYHCSVLRPRNFREGERYPTILSVYAGPGRQRVTASWHGSILDQWFADHGFIVVTVDGRGTPGRGREWERVIKGNLIDILLEDQVDALQALAARHREIDASRVGVYGWSFGGYFSAMAAMRRPDVFRAGVAGAPVCDWRDYDTHYTERYMGLPQENSAGYDASDVVTYCKDLRVPLLVIHGTADDNVYFLHSLKMTDALFRAGRHYEFLVLPGFTHMVPDPEVTRALYSRIAAFLARHVRGEE